MKVVVRLYATLRQFVPGSRTGEPLTIEAKDNLTVSGLLEHLGIPADVTKVVFVNGKQRDRDHVLQDGDEVAMFPPIAGGSY